MGVSGYLTISQYEDNAYWVNHTYQVAAGIEEAGHQMEALENDSRGFVLSGDERFLAPYASSSTRVEALLNQLQALTVDNPVQEEAIESLRPLVSERIEDARTKIQLRQAGTAQDVILKTDMVRARQLAASIDDILRKMGDEERRLLAARNSQMNFSHTFALVADVVGTLVSLAVVLFLLWYINKTFGQRKMAEEKLQESNQLLEVASAENARQNWILSGATRMNAGLQGELTVDELATKAVQELCAYLGAPVGTCYLVEADGRRLRLAGSYAFRGEGPFPQSILPGEGLLGQALREGRLISVAEVPSGYIRIHSSIGEGEPVHLLLLPLVHEGTVKGVVEIGCLVSPGPDKHEFLEFVQKDIAAGIHMAQSRRRLQTLNEQLREQAGELQRQQEELQASNEELTSQSEELQASEEELKAQQEELQQTNIKLQEKAAELERAGRYKSEFLANMSHELRTPLNSILILARLLSENKAENLTEKQREYASVIHRSGQDLLNLINDVLDLAKIESGKTTLSIRPVSLAEVRDNLVGLFGEVASARHIHFTAMLDTRCPSTVLTDREKVEQILRNLLSNAFKFTHEGGQVRLEIHLSGPGEEPELRGRTLGESRVLTFRVTDTGVGIARSQQELIFEAFQQADGSNNRRFGGTGLGLSISRQLAAMLDGILMVRSVEGEGSIFSLYLPLQEAGAFEYKGTNTVLIADDDPVFSAILRDFAREQGYDPVVVGQGDIALHYAEEYRPAAILLDIQLPVIDGWTVLSRLRANPRTRGIPVHVISGHRIPPGKEHLEANFLLKPVEKEVLEDVFKSIGDGVNHKGGRRVLVVEDNVVEREYLEQLIRDSGQGVSCAAASSAEEAIQRLQGSSFDCLILDLQLPGMNGFALLDNLKGQGVLNGMKVIVYTSRDITEEEEIRLGEFTNTIVLKNERSHERLLAEVTLFLHQVGEKTKGKAITVAWKQPPDQVLNGKKVLIVDDDNRNVFALTAVLRTQGIEVLTAGDGREALDRLEQNSGVDLVLLDIMMPGMDGYEALRRIRADKTFLKLPVIALTAKAMKDDRDKCIEAGASDYITKPVDTDQLLSLLRVWLYNGTAKS